MKPYSMDPIIPHLWVGAEPPQGATVSKRFRVLVLAAKEIQSASRYRGVHVIKAPLDDSGPPPTQQEVFTAHLAGIEVAKHVLARQSVLSTCHQGLNRSALVAALALVNLGWKPADAIARIRTARGSQALSNPYFVDVIHAAKE